ncbi:MAG: YeeE/YedE thiosulfate transporter family protein [Pseudomonadales bacterium]
MTLFIVALVLIATLGYLAQTTGLCMVRGVNEAASGKPLFLLAIVFSGAFAWVSVLIARLLELPVPFISYEITAMAVAGGLLFGLGAAFNNGCGVSTISKLARGQSAMLATIIGWLAGWVLLATFMPDQQRAHFQIPSEWHYGGLFVLSLVILLLVSRLNQSDKKIWASMMAIGLMAGIVFLYEPKWTPSGLLKDVSLALWHHAQGRWPSAERLILIAALVGGMAMAALWTQSFKFELSGWRVFLRHLFVGILMGVGAAIASGGNDSQLLLALPALSPAGGVVVLSMLIGIYFGKKII